jgi:hypothetical protein
MPVSNVNSSSATPSVLDNPNPNALTAEGLMLYLQTRLNGLDDQINGTFQKQKNMEAIRKALMKIQNALAGLDNDKAKKGLTGDGKFEAEIEAAIKEISAYDQKLGTQIHKDLMGQGQILSSPTYSANAGKNLFDNKYDGNEVVASKEYVDNLMKQLESSAQLEMIGLQSTMSARQTAIQLATNLVSALNKGTEQIAANVGR